MTAKRLCILLAGITLLAGLAVYAGLGGVIRSLLALGPLGLAIIVLIHLPVIFLMGLAWWLVGQDIAGTSLRKFIAARLTRDALAEILPFSQLGGFLGGLRLLHLSGSALVPGALSMTADLILEFAAKLLYTLTGLLILIALIPQAGVADRLFALVMIAGLGLAAALFFRKPVAAALKRATIWLTRSRWLAISQSDADADIDPYLRWQRALPSLLLHAGCWLFGAVEAWITLHLMGVAVTGPQALVIDSLATALRTFGFLLPGALGVQEAGYVLACALFGMPPAQAVALSLARRARDLLIALSGLGLWQWQEIRHHRRAKEESIRAA